MPMMQKPFQVKPQKINLSQGEKDPEMSEGEHTAENDQIDEGLRKNEETKTEEETWAEDDEKWNPNDVPTEVTEELIKYKYRLMK